MDGSTPILDEGEIDQVDTGSYSERLLLPCPISKNALFLITITITIYCIS